MRVSDVRDHACGGGWIDGWSLLRVSYVCVRINVCPRHVQSYFVANPCGSKSCAHLIDEGSSMARATSTADVSKEPKKGATFLSSTLALREVSGRSHASDCGFACSMQLQNVPKLRASQVVRVEKQIPVNKQIRYKKIGR